MDSLERLVLMPIQDPIELSSSLTITVAKLSSTDFYPPLFQAAFGTPEITSDRIARALAQFLRSLKSYRSPFDLVHNTLEGEDSVPMQTVFNTETLEGRSLFSSLGCDTCRGGALQIMRIANSNGLDATPLDVGAGAGRFRLSSLRNIEKTAPYMHDGRFATLREVIDHYDHGMKSVDELTTVFFGDNGKPKQLNLTESQKNALEAFLKLLTDHEFLADPRFSDPFN